jgi:hypothetical protein
MVDGTKARPTGRRPNAQTTCRSSELLACSHITRQIAHSSPDYDWAQGVVCLGVVNQVSRQTAAVVRQTNRSGKENNPMFDSNNPAAEPEQQAVAAAPAAPPSGNHDDLLSQLAEATAKIAAMQAERDRENVEREQRLAEQRLKVAATIAKQPSGKLGISEQDVKLAQAIRVCGGPAYWAKLSLQQQAEALGVTDVSVPDKTLRQYFGRGSDGAASNRLCAENRSEYLRLRLLAKLKGIY